MALSGCILALFEMGAEFNSNLEPKRFSNGRICGWKFGAGQGATERRIDWKKEISLFKMILL